MSPKAVQVGLGVLIIAMCSFSFVCGGCEDSQPDIEVKKAPTKPAKKSAKRKKQTTGLVEKTAESATAGLKLPQLTETDFIKGSKRRDPFEPFKELFVQKRETTRMVQREVKLKEFDISSLRLIGIITNIGDPRAMVVVPDGTGYVLKRGDYVGRADFIQQGAGGETIQVNWRVARIHGSGKEEERGVYFVRDDPTTTKGVDITRFLPLHPSE